LIFNLILIFSLTVFNQTKTNEGIEFYLNGEYENAVESILTTLETDKQNQILWRYLGMSFARLQNDSLAVKAFEKADTLFVNTSANDGERIKLISRPIASYTKKARQKYVQGSVKLAVEFGKNGKIAFIYPYKKLPDGMTESVISAVQKFEFEPATRNGKPITTIQIIEYKFSLF
jgi:tetratricopeptide (TPR) repeat protein